MRRYLTFDSDAWQKSKAHLREELLSSLRVDFEFANKDTLDQWWSPKARSILKQKVEYLKDLKRVEERSQEAREQQAARKAAEESRLKPSS